MSNTWNSYYVLFLSSVLALGIPASLASLSFILKILRKDSKETRKRPALRFDNPGTQPSFNQKINVRFFMAANAALVLITLGIELIPCVTTIQGGQSGHTSEGLLAIITLAGFASLGLIYSVRKGNMDWLTSDYMRKTSLDEEKV